MRIAASSSAVSWTVDDEAQSYDVIRGDLDVLRATGGDYTSAVSACVASHSIAQSASDSVLPSAGQGWFYVLRSRYAGALDPGTWDDGTPGQQGSRDAEIATSANGCPPRAPASGRTQSIRRSLRRPLQRGLHHRLRHARRLPRYEIVSPRTPRPASASDTKSTRTCVPICWRRSLLTSTEQLRRGFRPCLRRRGGFRCGGSSRDRRGRALGHGGKPSVLKLRIVGDGDRRLLQRVRQDLFAIDGVPPAALRLSRPQGGSRREDVSGAIVVSIQEAAPPP